MLRNRKEMWDNVSQILRKWRVCPILIKIVLIELKKGTARTAGVDIMEDNRTKQRVK